MSALPNLVTSPDALLTAGIAAAKSGDIARAHALLTSVTQLEPHNEQAWLWLSATVSTDDERRACLAHVLAVNPANAAAQRGLARLSPPQITAMSQRSPSPSPIAASPEHTVTHPPPAPPVHWRMLRRWVDGSILGALFGALQPIIYMAILFTVAASLGNTPAPPSTQLASSPSILAAAFASLLVWTAGGMVCGWRQTPVLATAGYDADGWVSATGLGWGLGWGLTSMASTLLAFQPHAAFQLAWAISPPFQWIVAGCVIGTCQALALRQTPSRALTWFLASIGIWVVGGLVQSLGALLGAGIALAVGAYAKGMGGILIASTFGMVVGTSAMGLFVGIVTGCLLMLIRVRARNGQD